MLSVPIVDGDRLVLVASFGGDDRHPAWYLNLQANPEVRATIAGSTRTMIARIATEEERAELWPQITSVFEGYACYQKRTQRKIRVVILTPKYPRGGHARGGRRDERKELKVGPPLNALFTQVPGETVRKAWKQLSGLALPAAKEFLLGPLWPPYACQIHAWGIACVTFCSVSKE